MCRQRVFIDPVSLPWGVEYAACQKLKSAYLNNRLRIATQTCGWYLKCSRHGRKCRITVLHALLAGWNCVVVIVPPHAVHWAVELLQRMPEKQHTYQNCSIIEACAASMQLSTQLYTIILSVLDQLEQLCMRHEGTYDNSAECRARSSL